MPTQAGKPHIYLLRGTPFPLWVCSMCGMFDGRGLSPALAYRNWAHFNRKRSYQEPAMVTITSRAATQTSMPKQEVWLIILVALAMVPLIGTFLGWW